jgi:uncharacterized protein (TIGR03435 family)
LRFIEINVQIASAPANNQKMADRNDSSLLREYTERQSESAFRELVQRHLNFVYSVAMRYVGNPVDAQDVSQAVFVILARKSAGLCGRTTLTGWLYETTRLTARQLLRTRTRRLAREQEACMQSTLDPSGGEQLWHQLAPHIEEAMSRLRADDRELLALRFYESKTGEEAAKLLGIGAASAHKRTTRALEKLQKFFAKRGVTSTTAAIAGAVSANSMLVAPAGLTLTIAGAALAKGAAASTSTLTLINGALKIMAWTKAKTAITAGVILLLFGGTTVVTIEKQREARRIEEMWRINKDLAPDRIDALPPMIKVLPTKFTSQWANWNAGTGGDKFVGANVRPKAMAMFAYGIPYVRIRFANEQPTNLFDFIATLPQGSREAMQQELKSKFGLVGHKVTETTNVLLLKVHHAGAPGLKPPIFGKSDSYMKEGAFHASNAPLGFGKGFQGLTGYLEGYFKMPVIDQTGITQRFSMDLRWRENKYRDNPDGLKQALLEKLGLELVPATMPVEFLIVDKVPE